MLGVYNYTVLLTYAGMLSAVGGMAAVLNGNSKTAILCLMAAGFCDMFDGKVASTKKNRSEKEKKFGIQIDSLSDLIAFGVLPAFILYDVSGRTPFSLCVAGLYVLGALIRLAYFNVEEEERQQETEEMRKVYSGLPVTSSALLIPIAASFVNSWTGPLVLAVIGVLFVTPFHIRKPGEVGKVCLLVFGLLEFAYIFL